MDLWIRIVRDLTLACVPHQWLERKCVLKRKIVLKLIL